MNWDAVMVPMASLEGGVLRPLNSEGRRLLQREGRRVEDLIDESGHSAWRRLLSRVELSGQAMWMDTTASNGPNTASKNLRIGVMKEGEGGAFTLTFVDRTEEHRRASERDRSARFLKELLDQTPTIFFVVDRSGHLVFRNAAFDALVRVPVDVVSRATLPQLTGAFHDRLDELFENGTEQALRTGETDSAERSSHFQLVLHPIRDRNSFVHQALVVGVNLTDLIEAHAEQRRLQEELEQARRLEALGQMAGTIAHDFNNFLQVMFSAASGIKELISNEDEDMVDSVDLLEEVLRQARELTQDLVSFSRAQMHSLRRSHLGPVVEAIVDAVQRLSPPGIELDVTRPSPEEVAHLSIPLSESQCLQIVVNLVQNAIEALHGKGRITTQLRVKDDVLQIYVEDDGPGVTPEVQSKIFEPFFTMREGDGGTGLGLTSARTLAQRVGGTLELQSSSLGGAAFVVALPLLVADADNEEPRT